ncbi:MAG: hypothetical protein HY079_03755 [Elusimicrobia bacterium]|nr:hypothetical protein [Elusimicrobiota bacterium]
MLRNRSHTLPLLLAAALCACAETEPARPAPPAEAPAAEPMPDDMPAILRETEAAYRGGRYDRGLALVKHALELKQTDVSTYDRLGSVYYVLGRHGDALSFWSRALPLEKDPDRRAALSRSIADTRAALGLPPEPAPWAEPESAPKPKPRPVLGPARRADPREVERLYKLGVKYYAEGQYLQATDAFLQVLDLDAGNADARKALERLRHESGGKTR